jgi:hypothetical protein
MHSTRHHDRNAAGEIDQATELEALSEREGKKRRKELKRLLDPSRPLDSWERYRALNDALDEVYETIDISNRETRFALILMGSLNAFVVLATARTDLFTLLDTGQRIWAATLLAIYAATALYFMLQAIEALRPRKFRPDISTCQVDPDQRPNGVRYFEDVIDRDLPDHCRAWRDVHMGQLNAELAVQLHSLARKSHANRIALRRLYAGLRVMTLLVAGLLVVFAYSIWV